MGRISPILYKINIGIPPSHSAAWTRLQIPQRMGSQAGESETTSLSARELDQVFAYLMICVLCSKHGSCVLQLYWRAVNAEREKQEFQDEVKQER